MTKKDLLEYEKSLPPNIIKQYKDGYKLTRQGKRLVKLLGADIAKPFMSEYILIMLLELINYKNESIK